MSLRTFDKSLYDFGPSALCFHPLFSHIPSVAGISSFFGLSVSMNRLTIRGGDSNILLPNARRTPIIIIIIIIIPVSVVWSVNVSVSHSAVCPTTGP